MQIVRFSLFTRGEDHLDYRVANFVRTQHDIKHAYWNQGMLATSWVQKHWSVLRFTTGFHGADCAIIPGCNCQVLDRTLLLLYSPWIRRRLNTCWNTEGKPNNDGRERLVPFSHRNRSECLSVHEQHLASVLMADQSNQVRFSIFQTKYKWLRILRKILLQRA
jgi:hypothetical protein